MKHINKLFFELIRVSIGVSGCLSKTPSSEEWKALYDMAKKQSLVGVCFAGVQKLVTQEQAPEEMLYLTWMGMAAKIQQRNEVVNRQCVDLQTKLKLDGIRSCVLKGQGIANLYSNNLRNLRQSGDIDIWVDGGREEMISYIKGFYPNSELNISSKHIEFCYQDDTEVEIHFMPTNTNIPIIGKRMRTFYKGEMEAQMSHIISMDFGKEMVVPDNKFQAIHILHHAFDHFLFEGVGLRQLLDYYFVMEQSYTEEQKDLILLIAKKFEVYRFAQAVSYILATVFGSKKCFIPADEKLGKKVLQCIMDEGNFGKYDTNCNRKNMKNGLYRFAYHNFRMWKHIKLAPWTICMTPLARAKFFIWRLSHDYIKR